MRARQFGRIHQLTLFWPLFPISCYLVEDDDGLTLVDTGLPQSVKGIVAYARRLGKPIVRIALTHCHGDHVGGLDGVKATFPLAEVAISAREARILAGDTSLDPHEPQTPLKGGFVSVTTKPDRLLSSGDTFGTLTAMCCPGHTPGHMVYYIEQDRAVIVGDAVQTVGGLTIAGQPNGWFPWVYRATWDAAMALRCARMLLDLDLSLLLCAHGPALHEPLPMLRRALQGGGRSKDKDRSDT
ncbi:MAG: MBL fold metallo-hydrolase [Coriobacteriales bacterium]|jgi:glyoxylase-like metal-dependent hydrolase (beta-lactamase superfamily II)|nr:MBL fold metallo-hydrolase [Coriobacteriales bacterium]